MSEQDREHKDKDYPWFTLPTFIEWLKTKAPDEKYRFSDNYNCALAQFAKANGYPNVFMGGFLWWPDGRDTTKSVLADFTGGCDIPEAFQGPELVRGGTFGGLLAEFTFADVPTEA